MTKQKETLFPKMESTGEIVQMFRTALQRAAEEAYIDQMFITNQSIREIREEAEQYDWYESEEHRQAAINCCKWDTKEDWIKDKIEEWLNG